MQHLTACKISVSLSFLSWIKNEMIFYHISELMLATLIQGYYKKLFHFKNERLTEILQVPHFMIVLIPYINLSNLFLDNKMSIFEEYGAFKSLPKKYKFNLFILIELRFYSQVNPLRSCRVCRSSSPHVS